ncbi:MAG: putative transposase [Mycobacterium sp.]|nr:putative transposase [Mycobacterium sp.]
MVFPDGSAGRVELTAALDIATRTPCAAILRPVATKAVDAAVLLARALTPLPMQPGWHDSVGFSRSILPAGMIPGVDELRAGIAAKPVIVPESITVDRGKVYVGSTFMNACERLQISVTKAAPRTPTDKPHIERVFAAINSGFTQYLAGYAGPNVVRRGKSLGQEAFWTLAEVQNLLDLWIVAVWQNKPHPGLRHPATRRI